MKPEDRTIILSEGLATRIASFAKELGASLSETVEFVLDRALEQKDSRPAIVQARGQRDGARQDPRLDWWREAKFGMFIHWGLYAIPAGVWRGKSIPGIGEWIMKRAKIPVAEYELLAQQFNPVKFNANEWVSIAKNAGQKYLVITSKHHDGFCMYKSEAGGYNIVDATPYGRDPMKELAAECERQGIKLGFYYSQTQDWHHPDGDGNDWDYVESEKDFAGYIEHYVKPQVREVLTNYGRIGLIWFDTPRRITAEQSQSLLDLVRKVQPDCLVCGRLGNALGDYASAGDNRIPEAAADIDWETPATINNTWGFKTHDHDWKSTENLIHKLVDIVSKGGVYLLNIGPTAEGVVPQPSVDRLLTMGDWLTRNGESVYATEPGPIQGLEWCRSTAKPGRVYLHVFDWPEEAVLRVPDLKNRVTKAYLLADEDHGEMGFAQEGGEVTVSVPGTAPDPIDTVVVLCVDEAA